MVRTTSTENFSIVRRCKDARFRFLGRFLSSVLIPVTFKFVSLNTWALLDEVAVVPFRSIPFFFVFRFLVVIPIAHRYPSGIVQS